jgi:hypothetical protein
MSPRPAGFHRDDRILRARRLGLVRHPVLCRVPAIPIVVHSTVVVPGVQWDFLVHHHPVTIPIESFHKLFECRERRVHGFIRPSAEIKPSPRREGRRADVPGDSLHHPTLLTGAHVIALQASGSGHHDLLHAGIPPIGRCAKTTRRIRPVRFPPFRPGVQVKRHQRGTPVLIPAHDYEVSDEDRRGSRSIFPRTRDHGQRLAPEFVALEIMANEPKRPKVADHPPAVRGGG